MEWLDAVKQQAIAWANVNSILCHHMASIGPNELTHPLGQNGRHFADNIFRCIFVNEKIYILTKISLKFVPKGPLDNKPSIGLDNGLAPNKRQAIIWTNAELIHWHIYGTQGGDELTHWGRDKMDAISQTIFSRAFSWMKTFEFRSIFHWSLFWRVQLTIFQHWFR